MQAEDMDPDQQSDESAESRHRINRERHEASTQTGDQPVPGVSEPGTITDMAKDGFVFFTPALLLTHGLFDRDPLLEFNRTHHTDVEGDRPFIIDCDYPFFQGLGKGLLNGALVDWDYRLYGVVQETWQALRDFIGNLGWYDPKRYTYARVGHHVLHLVDPTALHGTVVPLTEIPSITITVFCVSTYRNFIWMTEAADPPRTRPYPRVDPPKEHIKVEAEAILGPPPSPEQIQRFTQ